MVRYGQIVKARISDKNERHFGTSEGETFHRSTGVQICAKVTSWYQIEGLYLWNQGPQESNSSWLAKSSGPEVYGWGSVVSTFVRI